MSSGIEQYVVGFDGVAVGDPNLRRREAMSLAWSIILSENAGPMASVAIHEQTTGELRVAWLRGVHGWRMVESVPSWLS